MRLKALVFAFTFFSSFSLYAKFANFSPGMGDTAFRLAIAQFNPQHTQEFLYFSPQHLFMLEFLKQMPAEIGLEDYPLYASEERYTTLYNETLDNEIFLDWMDRTSSLMENCPMEETASIKKNNFSRVKSLHETSIEFLPGHFAANLECNKEIVNFFKAHQLSKIKLKQIHFSDGRQEGQLSISSLIKQDLVYVAKKVLASLHLGLTPKPLARQVDYYEKQVRNENTRAGLSLLDPIEIILEKRIQSQGELKIITTKVRALATFPGPQFSYEILKN